MNVVYVVHVVHINQGLERSLLMPNRKKLEITRRIQGAGYLCEIDTALRFNLPKLTIENNPFNSFAFNYCGGMGVILELRITSDRAVHIQDFGDLELLERPCNVDWWVNEESIFYSFHGGPEYPRDAVLNHRIGKHGTVKPGEPLEGVLLGYSATRIPSQYSHGLRLPLMLSILDGSDNPHPAQLLVQVDDNLCSKIRRQSRGSLYGPYSGNKPDLVDGVEDFAPREQQYENVHDPLMRQLRLRPAPAATRSPPAAARREYTNSMTTSVANRKAERKVTRRVPVRRFVPLTASGRMLAQPAPRQLQRQLPV